MKVTNKYIGAVLLGLGLAGMQSCSDAWDDHYNPADADVTTSTETLWEIISNNPNLSKFAEVAQKSHYYRDEKHPQADYTFKTMFQGTQLITVWAPQNDALTDAEWQKWNDFADHGLGYTVQQQLMANSIALWRNIANGGGIDTLAMLNGKKVAFDKDNATMAGLPIVEKNIAASNGTLHIVSSTLPFTYNLYEYLKDVQNTDVSKFHDFIIASDTTYFNEYGSIEGIPDMDGNPTYVDSAYTTTNAMFFGTHNFPTSGNNEMYDTYDESFGANIIAEDSSFIMLLPTNQAWTDAYNKLEKYYTYAPKYVDKRKQRENEIANGSVTDFREFDPDSLKAKNIPMDIVSPLVFNVNLQPKGTKDNYKIGQWEAEEFLDNVSQAPYVRNTYGDTLRTDDTWAKESLFDGTRVPMSNGIGIVSNTWNIPAKLYKPDLSVEIGYASLFNPNLGTGTVTPIDFSNEVAKAWVDTVGVVSNDNFYYLKPTQESGNPKFEFALVGSSSNMECSEAEVMSGKYDVYLVMVPNFYLTSTDTIDADVKKHVKHKVQASIFCNIGQTNGKDKEFKSSVVEYAGEKVDTLLLFQDFEFPYSYKNLRYCYPTMTITTSTTSGDRKNGYTNDICIDRIILKSKD